MEDLIKPTAQEAARKSTTLSKETVLYLNSIVIFFDAYKKGEISQKDMIEIEEKVVQKSGINPLSVYRINDLIIDRNRATIVSKGKEVISNEINKVRKITKTD